MTSTDYEVFSNLVGNLNQNIKDKKLLEKMMDEICSLSIWQKADLTFSEENYGNPIIKDDTMLCIKDNEYHLFKIVHRFGRKGDLIYIVDDSTIGDDYKGKYYRVFDRVTGIGKNGDTEGKARIRMIDTYSDTGDTYLILGSSAYVVLEPLELPKER